MGNDRRLWGLAIGASGLLAGLALAPVGLPLLLWPALAMLWALAGSPPAGWRPPVCPGPATGSRSSTAI
jgi:apolipoprotein N-acyltransferase